MADEAKAASLAHKRWILEFMKTQPDMKCSYDAIVQEGEKHHCIRPRPNPAAAARRASPHHRASESLRTHAAADARRRHPRRHAQALEKGQGPRVQADVPHVPDAQGRGGHADQPGLRC